MLAAAKRSMMNADLKSLSDKNDNGHESSDGSSSDESDQPSQSKRNWNKAEIESEQAITVIDTTKNA